MNKNIFSAQAAFMTLLVFCGSAFSQYWTGEGGKGIRLAVLEPEGKGISENEKWTLSVVQNVIYTDFSKYSDMTIIDRQNLEKVFEEWKESMSGNYSDEERVKIGNLTNASHILNGTVIKTPNAFMLELSVTDLQSGERKASYSQPVSASALENHSAIKEASADLLKQLGVDLTGTALDELKQAANIAKIQAEEALARGIVAKRQGTEVAALSYFYQAAALDPAMLEAANRSSVMAANISSGNIGEDARNDIAWRRDWVARLTEAEQFFDNLFKTNSISYTLLYSTKIIPGNIDYKTETQTLSINTNLHAPDAKIWLSSVEKSLQAVYDGLEATKRKRDWGLQDWPWKGVTELKPFNDKKKTFSIVAELLNDKGKVIGKANFESKGEWGFRGEFRGKPGPLKINRPSIYISNDDKKQVKFASVKADDITDNLTIRITSVNGTDASTAAKNGVLQIKATYEEDEADLQTIGKGGSGGIGDMLGGLMGGSAGGIGTKAKGSLKAPNAKDIDIGSGSSRSKPEITQVINARMPGVRNIYNKYLKLKPGLSGKVTLKFTIASSGNIIIIDIVSSTTNYAEFDEALKSMVSTWKWKTIKNGNTTATVPFDFGE